MKRKRIVSSGVTAFVAVMVAGDVRVGGDDGANRAERQDIRVRARCDVPPTRPRAC